MSANRPDFSPELIETREQLKKAQARIAELEAQLLQKPSSFITPSSTQDHYHHTFDHMLEGCQVIGFDWRYLYVNDSAALQGQQKKEELLGHTMMERYPGIENTALFAVLQECMQQRVFRDMETEFQYPDGQSGWFKLSVQPVDEGIFILSLDITERKRSELAVQRYAERMGMLHQIDLHLMQGISYHELVEITFKHLRQLIPCQRIDLVILDEQRGDAVVFMAVADQETNLGKGVRIPVPPDIFEGYDAQHTRIFDDIRLFEETRPRAKQLAAEGLRSALSTLLMDVDKPAGVLGFFSETPGFFTAEHTEIAAEIGSQLTIALRQIRLNEELERHAVLLEGRVAERTAELQAAKDHLEAILDNSREGIVLIDRQLRVRQTNAAFNRLFGLKDGDYLNRALSDLLLPEDQPILTRAFQTEVADEQGIDVEARVRRQDNTVFEAEFSIGIIKNNGFVCTIRDITRRKEQERQFRYHASLQENVSDAVIVTDMSFRIQSWNRAAERIYGWTAEEAVGKSSVELLRTAFVDPAEREMILNQLYNRGWWQREVTQHDRNGNLLAILGSITLIRDENGAPFSIVAVNRDITERHLVEEAMQKSAAEIHDLYNNAPCGYHSIDSTGLIVQINDTELRWLGYTREETVNRLRITDICTPESVALFQAKFPAFKEKGVIQDLELDFVRKDGSVMPILLNSTAVYDEQGQYLWSRSSLFDITELRRARRALTESETRFRVVIEAAPIAKVVSNQAGIITLINAKTESLFGYKRGELIGKPIEVLLPEYARERHRDNRASYIASPRMRQMGLGMELNARRKDGSEFPVEIELSYAEISGEILVIAFVVDISERKRSAAEIERQRTFLQQVIDVSPSLISVKDYNGNFVLVNPPLASMYNTTTEALTGRTESDFNLSTHDVANSLELERQVIVSGESRFLEECIINGAGETRWLQTTKVPIGSIDGSSKYVLSVATDITERKWAEEALQLALTKEKELNELKTRFVSMASHEFRTPLATILALTETLVTYRRRLSDEQIDDKFRKIKDQIAHLKDIMEDVLLLARLQARRVTFNPVLLDLDALSRSVLDEFQSQPEFTHIIEYTCDPALHRVTLDKKLMRQTINNLVSNAIKYSAKDSTVRVNLKHDNGTLLLLIQDEGIGIPAEDIQHLFDPFYRAGNVGTISGTGLGLVITRESVELHGGTIAVDSQLNQGTTFTIRIPLSATGENDNDENTRD